MSDPLSEEEIVAATVGERRPHNDTITLVPYDPSWPATYERLAALIREALGDKVLLVEHVGSTSVPGLMAKPIIDILLAVADSADEAAYVPQLGRRGFVLRIREPNWHEHRMLRTPIAEGHLHVFTMACEEIERMLRFRDWLRAHPEDRAQYEAEKRKLAAQTWTYLQNYADAKSAVVEGILARATGGHA